MRRSMLGQEEQRVSWPPAPSITAADKECRQQERIAQRQRQGKSSDEPRGLPTKSGAVSFARVANRREWLKSRDMVRVAMSLVASRQRVARNRMRRVPDTDKEWRGAARGGGTG